ncbi:integrin beta-nu isoform X1 [Trichoplusia ni]|uniref:Integrin beta n=1 Tax=Trichoplusia ni TaxID=7111 RepID=A0A7E5X007_TRINI|nr:integrin beta-nu isoform X1 [Trichoplusia ni]
MYVPVFVILCLLFVKFENGNCQAQQMLNKLVCIEHDECGACLSAASHCRWCADPNYNTGAPRCNDDESLVNTNCSQGFIQRPAKPVWNVVENSSLQDMRPNSAENVIQIQPQRIQLSLKPRETKKISFSFRPAKNYPLDLYYLMDLTWSMKDDKETLVSLRDDLPTLLKNLTDNFRLGFGSFAEKPLMPFISTDSRRLANPCSVEEVACEATYSYRHHLSLTNQVSDFIEHVNSSSVTANLDNAEAQLDALVQVISCGDKIGWATHSRKIVILLSDGLMHTAGDGKLGGATKKNDEQCHLDERGYYSDAATYDYPSVAQMYRLLDKYKVNVIFAVTESVKNHYDSLNQLLEDFTYVAKLESDSSNILKLVKTGYEDIVSVVDFHDDSSSGPVKVRYFTDCGVKGRPLIEGTRCTGVEYGMTLNYEAHVTLEACSDFKSSTQTIRISESQLGQDALTLEVDIQCGCECSNSVQEVVTPMCPANSHLVCGVCQCNKGWSGPQCNCEIGDENASAELLAQCREPNATRSILCSGAGDCLCGKCECDWGYSGRYCQCKSCEVSSYNELECGGVDRGVCVCGQCACEAGWVGAACDCPLSNDTCKPPSGGEVCSGNGDCVCGSCECTIAQDGSKYIGKFCETCPTCENPLCIHAEPCVSCHLNTGCTDSCTIGNVNYTVIERLSNTEDPYSSDVMCIFRQEEGSLECEYKYTYSPVQSESGIEISIRSKECYQPTSAMIMTSGLVIFGCVIAAGLIIILAVKSGQIVSDRRAYAKFLKEAQESRRNMQELNPLYISPISEFRLPDSFPRDKND